MLSMQRDNMSARSRVGITIVTWGCGSGATDALPARGKGRGLASRLQSGSFRMLLDGPSRRRLRIAFLVDVARSGPRNRPPVIQHMRNVTNPARLRLFDHAQRQVVVLAALEAFAEASHPPDDLRPVNTEVTDHVLPVEELGVPIRT